MAAIVMVVDTSAWIEFLADGPLARQVRARLPRREEWIVPTIVQLELAKWMTRERGADAADEVIAFTMKCNIAPLSTEIALDAAAACAAHKLATADAIVYVTAQACRAGLLTCDAHFSGLAGVTLLAKGKSQS